MTVIKNGREYPSYRQWDKDGTEHTYVRTTPRTKAEKEALAAERAEAEQMRARGKERHQIQKDREAVAKRIGFETKHPLGAFPPMREMCKAVAMPTDGEPAMLSKNQRSLLLDGEDTLGEINVCAAMLDEILDTGVPENDGKDIYLFAQLLAHIATMERWFYRLFDAMLCGDVLDRVGSVYQHDHAIRAADKAEREARRARREQPDGAAALANASEAGAGSDGLQARSIMIAEGDLERLVTKATR